MLPPLSLSCLHTRARARANTVLSNLVQSGLMTEGQVIGAFYGPYAAELNLFGKLVLADGRQLLVFFFQQP